MQCNICFRDHQRETLPFLCAVDARNRLYEPRVRHAEALLEKDRLEQLIARSLGVRDSLPLPSLLPIHASPPPDEGARRHRLASNYAELQAATAVARDRITAVLDRAEALRRAVESTRAELARQKALVQRRAADLRRQATGAQARQARQLDEVQKGIRMARYRWNQTQAQNVPARITLCAEAARLCGLERVARKASVGRREVYRIGGVDIVDLRDLNTASPAQISTSLGHMVHLMVLAAHYLGIRLPAEVTLPHRDYPLPTIFSLANSHVHSNVPFPGTGTSRSGSGSPLDSRQTEQTGQPRPRALYVSKPLPLLAHEDPATYALFLEGVTLLAYDIAWLCCSQGVTVGESNSFEDICAIGRNLYNVLVIGESSRSLTQAVSSDISGKKATKDEQFVTVSPGQYSHSTTHTFLASATGTEFTRSWKLPSPLKLADQVKAFLMNELANAEWEVVEADAWADGGHDGIDAGHPPNSAVDHQSRGAVRQEAFPPHAGMQSFMSMRSVVHVGSHVRERGQSGTSGWMKLKSRIGEQA